MTLPVVDIHDIHVSHRVRLSDTEELHISRCYKSVKLLPPDTSISFNFSQYCPYGSFADRNPITIAAVLPPYGCKPTGARVLPDSAGGHPSITGVRIACDVVPSAVSAGGIHAGDDVSGPAAVARIYERNAHANAASITSAHANHIQSSAPIAAGHIHHL